MLAATSAIALIPGRGTQGNSGTNGVAGRFRGDGARTEMPATRDELHQDLLNQGYKCNGTSEGNYVTYTYPDGRCVDIRPSGGHNTGEYVESVGEDTFLPLKPKK